MIETKTTKNFDFGKFDLDLSEQLNESAEVVKADIQAHYQSQISIADNKPYAPLKASTIKAKLASKNETVVKNAHKILFATENLWKNQKITKATKKVQAAKINIGSTREEIAVYLQEGNDNMEARPHFGISPDAEKKIDRYMVLAVDRKLRAV